MLATNLYMQELFHQEHLASMQQAAQEARRLHQMEGHTDYDREAQHAARLVLRLGGALALVLVLLR